MLAKPISMAWVPAAAGPPSVWACTRHAQQLPGAVTTTKKGVCTRHWHARRCEASSQGWPGRCDISTQLCRHPPAFTSVPAAATFDSILRDPELLWDVRRRAGGAPRLTVPNQNPLLPGTSSRLPGRSAGVPIWANSGVCSSSSHLLPGLQSGGSASRQQGLKIRLAGRQHSMTPAARLLPGLQCASAACYQPLGEVMQAALPGLQATMAIWLSIRQCTGWQAASVSLIGSLDERVFCKA